MKKVTTERLVEMGACDEGVEAYKKRWKGLTEAAVIRRLMHPQTRAWVKREYASESLEWANWLIVRLLDRHDKVRYAIFAAEQVLHFFEGKHPDDKRPRQAIEAARRYLETPCDAADAAYAAYATAYAAYVADAAYAARAAADAAYAADAAARAAAYAAYAAYAAADAAYAAYAAADAAYAAYAARAAARAAGEGGDQEWAKMLRSILRYGVELIEAQKAG
jgi:hypothetical protein